MTKFDPVESDEQQTLPKRICPICGKKMSQLNNTGCCFHHPDPEKKRRQFEREAYLEKIRGQTPKEEVRTYKQLEPEGKVKREKSLRGTIISLVCQIYGVDLEELTRQNRKEAVVRVRHILMYLLYMDTNLSYSAIGELLGGRDHSTIIHGIQKISSELQEDSSLQNTVQQLRSYYQTPTEM